MPYISVSTPGVPAPIAVVSPREIGYLKKVRIENGGTIPATVMLLDSYSRVYFDSTTSTAGTESVTGTIITITVDGTSAVDLSDFVNTKLYGTIMVQSTGVPVSVFVDYDVR